MKIMKIALVLLLLLNTTGCVLNPKVKSEDGAVVFDMKTKMFDVEEGASLQIVVPDAEYGIALSELWDSVHPEHAGILDCSVLSDRSALFYLYDNEYDLMYIKETELPLIMDLVRPIDESAVASFEAYNVEKFARVINHESYLFLPMSYDGFLFAYDEEMLQELGINLADADDDGLPDSIDTWEKLFRRAFIYGQTGKKYPFKELFSLQFNEKNSFYAFLTAGGWEMFESLTSLEAGFDRDEFRQGLNFIHDLGKYDWNLHKGSTSEDYVFNYETVLVERSAPLTMISLWMYFEDYENANQSRYRFAHMPSYAGQILSPLTTLDGYAINRNTNYPSAVNELLRLMRSKEGLKLLANVSSVVPVIRIDADCDIEITDPRKYEMIRAFSYSVTEPLIALKNNTTIRAWQMYYDIDWTSVVKDLYDHRITVSEAQARIVELSEQWLIDRKEKKN